MPTSAITFRHRVSPQLKTFPTTPTRITDKWAGGELDTRMAWEWAQVTRLIPSAAAECAANLVGQNPGLMASVKDVWDAGRPNADCIEAALTVVAADATAVAADTST